jgi:hypothetical protein
MCNSRTPGATFSCQAQRVAGHQPERKWMRGVNVDDNYGPEEPQASGDSTKGGGVAGGKAAKWEIVDMFGRVM